MYFATLTLLVVFSLLTGGSESSPEVLQKETRMTEDQEHSRIATRSTESEDDAEDEAIIGDIVLRALKEMESKERDTDFLTEILKSKFLKKSK